jgi:hypothetical protein
MFGENRIKTATCFAELKISSATFIPSKFGIVQRCQIKSCLILSFTSLVINRI